MKKLVLILFVVLCCGSIVLATEPADRQTYRLRLSPEQSFRTDVESTQTVVQEIMGTKFTDTQRIHMVIIEDVLRVDEKGNMLVKARYESIAFDMKGTTGTFFFDTEQDPALDNNPVSKALRALVGASFELKYSPDGRVLDVRGTDDLLQRMINALEIPDNQQKEAVESALTGIYGEESMKEMFEQISGPYPSTPVCVGDHWKIHQRLTQGFALDTETTFQLKERKNGQAVITMNGTIATLPDGSTMSLGTVKFNYKLTGTQNGTYYMAETTGWVDEADVYLQLSGEVTAEMDSQGEVTMTWPVSIVSTIKIKSTEVVAAS